MTLLTAVENNFGAPLAPPAPGRFVRFIFEGGIYTTGLHFATKWDWAMLADGRLIRPIKPEFPPPDFDGPLQLTIETGRHKIFVATRLEGGATQLALHSCMQIVYNNERYIAPLNARCNGATIGFDYGGDKAIVCRVDMWSPPITSNQIETYHIVQGQQTGEVLIARLDEDQSGMPESASRRNRNGKPKAKGKKH